MNNTEAVKIIKTYTANFIAAEPESPLDVVNTNVAAVFALYLAAAIDPGKYAYHPHPYNAAETALHNAAAHLFAQVAS